MAEKSFSGKIIANGTAINIGNGSSAASGVEPYIIYMSHADFSVFTNTATDQFQNDGNTATNQNKVLNGKKDAGTADTLSSKGSITDNDYLSYDTFGYGITYNDADDSDKKMIQEIITAFFMGRPVYLYLNTPYRYSTNDSTTDADDYYEYIKLNNYIGSNRTNTNDDTTDIYLTFKHNNNELLYIHMAGTGDRIIDDFDRTYVLYFKDVPNAIADLNGFVENDTLIGKWATTTE